MNPNSWKNTMIQNRPWALPEAEWYTTRPDLADLTDTFAPIDLKEMDAVALLNRTDTKFVLTDRQLLAALSAVRPYYRILAVQRQRLNHYRTLYFDTPDFDLFQWHVNGRADRYKIRSREYTDSGAAFFEVKHKTPKGRTLKTRISTSQMLTGMAPEAEAWLRGVFPYPARALEPRLWNTFTRITLVNKQGCERVTLDTDLAFYSAHKIIHLDGIAIAEVKLDGGLHASPFLAQMRAQKVQPRGFSKYCLGVALLYEQVKKNALKPQLLRLQKMAAVDYLHQS